MKQTNSKLNENNNIRTSVLFYGTLLKIKYPNSIHGSNYRTKLEIKTCKLKSTKYEVHFTNVAANMIDNWSLRDDPKGRKSSQYQWQFE